MGKSNVNWDPNTKKAFESAKKGRQNIEVGIDAQSEERVNELGKNIRKKRGFWKFVVILIIFLLIFDEFFMDGELVINIIKNLLG